MLAAMEMGMSMKMLVRPRTGKTSTPRKHKASDIKRQKRKISQVNKRINR